MSDRMNQLVALAFDPQETTAEFHERLMTLAIHECLYTIQRAMTRDGNTPANERSWRHVEEICARFDMEVPTDYSDEFIDSYRAACK